MSVVDIGEERIRKSKHLDFINKESAALIQHFAARGVQPEDIIDVMDFARFRLLNLLWVTMNEDQMSAEDQEKTVDRIYELIEGYRIEQGLPGWMEQATGKIKAP